jgi:dipeptidyl aminopeptidase/acylaminoacyl peptidase
MNSPKYANFDIAEVSYKIIDGQEIQLYVLTPKNASTGKHPVVAEFHGGWLVCSPVLFL